MIEFTYCPFCQKGQKADKKVSFMWGHYGSLTIFACGAESFSWYHNRKNRIGWVKNCREVEAKKNISEPNGTNTESCI